MRGHGGEPRLCPPYEGGSVNDVAVHAFLEGPVVAAVGAAADQTDLLEVVSGLEPIALFELPHAVILPGAGVVRIGDKRTLVPDLGVLVAAELAARIADVVRDLGVVVPAERVHGGG